MSSTSSKHVKRRHLAFLQRKIIDSPELSFRSQMLFLVISNRGHGHSTQDRLWTSPPSLVGPRWRYPARRVWKPGRGSITKGRTTSLSVFLSFMKESSFFCNLKEWISFFGLHQAHCSGETSCFFVFFSTLTMGIYLRDLRGDIVFLLGCVFFSIPRSVQHTFQVRETPWKCGESRDFQPIWPKIKSQWHADLFMNWTIQDLVEIWES